MVDCATGGISSREQGMPRPIKREAPPVPEDSQPLTIGEFRRGVAAIVDAVGKLNASRYYKRISDENWSVSIAAPTMRELEAMERKEFPK